MYMPLSMVMSVSLLIHAENTITIRSAQQSDLPTIFALDRSISYEYFKPFYQQQYAHFEFGKNPDFFLEQELVADEHAFKKMFEQGVHRMLIALDAEKIVGFIYFHQEEKMLEIDLLLVAKEYRRGGIGRKLVQAMPAHHPQVIGCRVYPFRQGNEAALAFYESLGFINKGIPKVDRKNVYGIAYAELYWWYELVL